MTNKQIYAKTLTFSLRRLLIDFLTVLLFVALSAAGFLIADKTVDKGLIGLGIGAVIGLIVIILVARFVSYNLKAGQIAMMTKGVTEGTLPDDVYAAGKREVKERFATVAVFFAVTGAIKGVFNQIGRLLTGAGKAVGGDTGETVASVISTAIQVLIGFLCDCCLGWVLYRKDQKAFRAACEGAVLFFKHGKTLAKNMGRIFGMGLASLILIGGAFSGVFYAIFSQFPASFESLHAEIVEAVTRAGAEMPEILKDPAMLLIVCAVLCGILLWSILHSVFVRPFILTGVLRNYMESGMKDIPTEESFRTLDAKSAKFAKLHARMNEA